MAGVRCPKCGVMNLDGQRRTARCRACQEELGKCRYCRYYDARVVDCTHLSRRETDHVMDADDVANCPDFSSALSRPDPPRSRPVVLLTALFVLIAASAVAVTVLHVVRSATRISPGLPVEMRLSAPDSVLKEESLDLEVSLTNTGAEALREVEVQVAGHGMAALTCLGVAPPETPYDARGGLVVARVEDLAPGGRCALTFRFQAHRTGRIALLVSTTSATTSGSKVVSVKSEIIP